MYNTHIIDDAIITQEESNLLWVYGLNRIYFKYPFSDSSSYTFFAHSPNSLVYEIEGSRTHISVDVMVKGETILGYYRASGITADFITSLYDSGRKDVLVQHEIRNLLVGYTRIDYNRIYANNDYNLVTDFKRLLEPGEGITQKYVNGLDIDIYIGISNFEYVTFGTKGD